MRICRRAQKVTVKARLLLDARSFFQISTRVGQLIELWHFSAVTQRDRNGIVRVTRRHECCDHKLAFYWRPGRALFIDCDLQQIAGLNAQPFRVSRTDQRRVVPGQFCDWVGQFLKPAVIGVAAIVHRIAGR